MHSINKSTKFLTLRYEVIALLTSSGQYMGQLRGDSSAQILARVPLWVGKKWLLLVPLSICLAEDRCHQEHGSESGLHNPFLGDSNQALV